MIDIKSLKGYVKGHSLFAPSASHRWLICPGSLLANATLPPQPYGEAAAYGTVAHSLSELWLKSGEEPIHKLHTIERVGDFDIEIDEEMLDVARQYVDWCRLLPGKHFIESRVSFSKYTPIKNQSGTCDHAAATKHKLVITDLKAGIQVLVSAEKNPQLMLYALGFYLKYNWAYDFKEFTIRIAQPRRSNFSTYSFDKSELLAFADTVRGASTEALKKSANRVPDSDACQYCRAKVTCPAYPILLKRLTDDYFEDLVVTDKDVDEFNKTFTTGEYSFCDIKNLTISQIERIASHKKGIVSWLNEVENHLYNLLLKKNSEVTQYKLVKGKDSRKWVTPKLADAFFDLHGIDEDVYAPRTMISPAAGEAVLKKMGFKTDEIDKLYKPLVMRKSGSPTMVKVSDKRQSIFEQDESDWFSDL